MFQIPFPVEIWGTVSDWIMIVVTTITAWFLYKTLQSQKDVQQAQNKLLEIEQIRLIEQFKPVIGYYNIPDRTEEKYVERLVNGTEFLSVAAKNLSDNIAINYKFITPVNPQVEAVEWFSSQPNLIKGNDFGAIHFIINNFNKMTIRLL